MAAAGWSALSTHTRVSWNRVSQQNGSGTRLKLPIARSTRPASSASLTPILLGRILSSALGASARTRAMRAGISTVPTYSPQAIVKRRSVCSGTNSVGPSASCNCSSPSRGRGAISEARGVGRMPSATRTNNSSWST